MRMDMYGIPGHVPTSWEPRPAGEWFSNTPDVYLQTEATEDALDVTLAARFPASDALSITQRGGGTHTYFQRS
ncbi:MAG: hypothetical protein ACT4NU_10805 [Chromatiales bacterium]